MERPRSAPRSYRELRGIESPQKATRDAPEVMRFGADDEAAAYDAHTGAGADVLVQTPDGVEVWPAAEELDPAQQFERAPPVVETYADGSLMTAETEEDLLQLTFDMGDVDWQIKLLKGFLAETDKDLDLLLWVLTESLRKKFDLRDAEQLQIEEDFPRPPAGRRTSPLGRGTRAPPQQQLQQQQPAQYIRTADGGVEVWPEDGAYGSSGSAGPVGGPGSPFMSAQLKGNVAEGLGFYGSTQAEALREQVREQLSCGALWTHVAIHTPRAMLRSSL